MILPRQKRFAVVAVGIVLGTTLVLGFNAWLGAVIERHKQDEVAAAAVRAVRLVETRLNAAMDGLEGIARRGIETCTPELAEELRQAVITIPPVKSLALVDRDGMPHCTNNRTPFVQRAVMGSSPVVGAESSSVEVVLFDPPDKQYVRLRREFKNGNSVAALVPVELLLPMMTVHGGSFPTSARLTMRDGTVIVESGTQISPAMREQGVLTARAHSARFGISALSEMPRSARDPLTANLWAIGVAVDLLVMIGVVLVTWWWLRPRPGTHPLDDVERALAAGEFVAYYQPIIDITAAKLLGAEVLVRWRKPDGSLISPAAFVPMLEQGGLIMEMTRQLMRRVRTEVGQALVHRPNLHVWFNLTAAHFADDEIVDDVRAIFEGSPIRFSQVVLELTERQPLRSVTATRRVIAALQGLGCSIALDDVGTGHSGLSAILRLGVDIIKIDKLFVDSIVSERHSATIIETLVDLARNMRMFVVAEGVETFEQVTDLRARGIRAAQGYVFSPPLPPASFLSLLEAMDPLSADGAEASPRELKMFTAATLAR